MNINALEGKKLKGNLNNCQFTIFQSASLDFSLGIEENTHFSFLQLYSEVMFVSHFYIRQCLGEVNTEVLN